jgi:exonuclease VII small subunit
MKQREYMEGPKALENFERGMKALFKVPTAAIVQAKKRVETASSGRKPKKADKD